MIRRPPTPGPACIHMVVSTSPDSLCSTHYEYQKYQKHKQLPFCSWTLQNGSCFPLSRALPPRMVDGILPFQNDLRNGNKGVAFLQQAFNNPRQCSRSILRRVVKQDDAPRADSGGHPFGDVGSRQVFPIQAVTIPYKGKSLACNGSPMLYYLILPVSTNCNGFTIQAHSPRIFSFILVSHGIIAN